VSKTDNTDKEMAMTTEERMAIAERVAQKINDAGEAMQAGVSNRVSAAAWARGDIVRVYCKDGRGFTGRDLGYLDVDADGDVTGYGRCHYRIQSTLDAAGVETYA